MPQFSVNIVTEVDEGFVKDFMDTLGDASAYWARVKVLEHYASEDDWSSVKKVRIKELEASEEGGVKTYEFDAESLILGIKRVLERQENGEYLTNSATRKSVMQAVLDNDIAHMDVWDVDWVVQAAMFNEIVYW